MVKKELWLIAQAKDNASKVLGGVSGAVKGLGGIAGTVATGGLAALAAGITGMGAGAVVAGKEVMDFTTDLNSGMRDAQTQLGLTTEEMDDLRQSAKGVFEEGFGDNISDVTEGMTEVRRVTRLTGEELESATENAIVLRDAFGIDIAESVSIAESAVASDFVPSIEEANDLLAKGFQMGLAEDWGDTINEYSGDFARLGIDGSQALSMINAGMEAGAHNTDVIADGFREMGIRLMEGGDEMSATFDAMGLDFDQMQAKVASGEAVWGDFTGEITTSLAGMDDAVERNAAGVAIFGSKWEDIGEDVFLAAGQATEGVEGLTGTMEEAEENMNKGFGPTVEKLKRTVISNFEPIAKAGTDLLDDLTPLVESAAEWFGDKIPKAIGWLRTKWGTHFPAMREGIRRFWNGIRPGLEWIRDTFQHYYSTYIPRLREAWSRLQEGFEEIRRMVINQLKPAWDELSESLGFGEERTGKFMKAIGDLAGKILNMNVEGIILGVKGAVFLLSGVFRTATAVMDTFKWGLNGVRDAAQWLKDKIWGLRDALSGIGDNVPDWLIPGSPTPFEIGLRGIADAAKVVQGGLSATVAATAPTQNIVGGGGVTIINKFGRDSVRSDEDIMKIVRQIERSTRLRGARVSL